MSDRTVHVSAVGEEIVRYERSGKWWIELVPPSPWAPLRKQVPIMEAAQRAHELLEQGGIHHVAQPGGTHFDRLMESA